MECLWERQEVFKDLVVSKKDLQRTAFEDCQSKCLQGVEGVGGADGKRSFGTRAKQAQVEDERARTMQRLDVTRTAIPWSGSHDRSSFGSCSSSLAPNTDEAMSASSRMAQEVDEAISEASWTALAKEKARDWWSIDLEGDVEELEVGCPWTVTKGDSMDPEGEMNNNSDCKKAAIEEEENLGTMKEDGMEVEMEVDASVPQAESVEMKGPQKEGDSCRIGRNPRLRLWDAGNPS